MSGEANDPKGNANAAVEHADGSSRSKVIEDTKGVESEGCREGASKRESVDEVDGSAGRGTGPADMSNELMEFIAVSIEPEDLGSGEILCMYLGGMWMRADDANRPGNGADGSSYQTDGSTGQTDASNASNGPEMAGMSCGEGAGTYLGTGDAKRDGDKTDGIGSHTDLPTGHGDIPSVANDMNISANDRRNIRMRQNESRTRNSLCTLENETSKHATRWRRVSAAGVDVYIPWNAPIEALGRTFEFGEADSRDEAIAPSLEGERAGDGDGR